MGIDYVRRDYTNCECGLSVQIRYLTQHFKTKIHSRRLEEMKTQKRYLPPSSEACPLLVNSSSSGSNQ